MEVSRDNFLYHIADGLDYTFSVKSWALSVKRSNFYLSAVAVFAEVELSTFNF